MKPAASCCLPGHWCMCLASFHLSVPGPQVRKLRPCHHPSPRPTFQVTVRALPSILTPCAVTKVKSQELHPGQGQGGPRKLLEEQGEPCDGT